MTSFTVDPADYIGTHRYTADPVFDVCDCHEVCGVLLRVEDVAPDSGHVAEHAYIAAGFPYVTYVHGVRAWPDDDERSLHDTRFPITGGLYDGYEVGGRP